MSKYYDQKVIELTDLILILFRNVSRQDLAQLQYIYNLDDFKLFKIFTYATTLIKFILQNTDDFDKLSSIDKSSIINLISVFYEQDDKRIAGAIGTFKYILKNYKSNKFDDLSKIVEEVSKISTRIYAYSKDAAASEEVFKTLNISTTFETIASIIDKLVSERVTIYMKEFLIRSIDNSLSIDVVKYLKFILSQFSLKKGNTTPEGKKDDEFEEYVFASTRVDTPDEPDTEIEKKVIEGLTLYIQDNEQLTNEVIDVLVNILSQKKYPKIFKNASNLIYRGISLDVFEMKKIFGGVPDVKPFDENGEPIYYMTKGTLSPIKGRVSSWSNSQEVAWDFASAGYSHKEYKVVFVSDQKEKTLSLENVYNTLNLLDYTNEDETLAFDDISFIGFYVAFYE